MSCYSDYFIFEFFGTDELSYPNMKKLVSKFREMYYGKYDTDEKIKNTFALQNLRQITNANTDIEFDIDEEYKFTIEITNLSSKGKGVAHYMLHNNNAIFQAASQTNCLEMINLHITHQTSALVVIRAIKHRVLLLLLQLLLTRRLEII